MAKVVVISGTPGVGKSTVARALAQRVVRGVHLKADTLQRMIVSGGEWPSEGTPQALEQLLLRTRNAAGLAYSFWSAGFDVLLDEVIASKQQLVEFDSALRSAPVHLVVLEASPGTVLDRDGGRHKQTAANYVEVATQIRELLCDRALFVDSSTMSVPETVAAVQALIPDLDWRPGVGEAAL